MMHFQLFNGFHAKLDDGQSLNALSRKSECLICLLALSDGMEVSREKAAGIIWSDRGEEQARASLRQELSQIRRVIGSEAITSDSRSIRLVLEHVTIDVLEFRDKRRYVHGRHPEELRYLLCHLIGYAVRCEFIS